MIRKNIPHWTKFPEFESCLFFVQKLDELLFDYTIDTYKHQALNTILLIREALIIYDVIDEGYSDNQNIKAILEELNSKYSHDIIAKSLVKDEYNLYLPITDFENNTENKLKLELLRHKLRGASYISKCKELLIEAISKNAKRDISNLTSSLITTLKAAGYSQTYLFKKTQESFYDFNKEINSVNQIESFLNIFDLKSRTFDVLFKASSLYLEIQSSCKSFNIEIHKTIPRHFVDHDVKFTHKKINNDIYILCKDIDAKDGIKARYFAERLTDKISNLFIFFHHKEKPKISNESLVYDKTNKGLFKASEQTSPMTKGFDLKPKKAALRLNEVLKNFGVSKDSFERIDKAIDLHGIAVDNRNVENQLLNLWISFETLIQGNDKKGKVHQVIDCIMPIIKSSYVKMLLDDAVKSLSRWNGLKLASLLSQIQIGNTATEKTYALILSEECEQSRIELGKALNDFPLLRNRIFELNRNLHKGSKMLDTISEHDRRVQWQIRRIYRTRNLIVHKGGSFINADILVENAHTYFDIFINKLYALVINGKQINTIEQGIKEMELEWIRKEKFLTKHKNDSITLANVLEFVV
jgi:hypothetical protein